MIDAYDRLCQVLRDKQGTVFIALSGGIDSLTLMTVAARIRTCPTIAMHAVSAAVPLDATERCRSVAARFNWQLREINAYEFDDNDYMSNPHDRCYYCKNSLFTAIEACQEAAGEFTIATGTNLDDLSDFRPGLKAASEHRVWQPFVDADIDKNMIRSIASREGLGELSALPAAPCLSSRIETGIFINTGDLSLIYKVEQLIARLSAPGDIRCRVTAAGVVVQLPADSSVFNDENLRARATDEIVTLCAPTGKTFIGFEPYRKGSAFIKPHTVMRAGR